MHLVRQKVKKPCKEKEKEKKREENEDKKPRQKLKDVKEH
jgi:hypothetical protein